MTTWSRWCRARINVGELAARIEADDEDDALRLFRRELDAQSRPRGSVLIRSETGSKTLAPYKPSAP